MGFFGGIVEREMHFYIAIQEKYGTILCEDHVSKRQSLLFCAGML